MSALPPWDKWADEYEDNSLYNLELALDRVVIEAITIVRRDGGGYQVSVRRDTDGWEVYFGNDLGDTIARAVMLGPQSPPQPVGTLAPWQEEPLTPLPYYVSNAVDDGVPYAFNSEGIEPWHRNQT